MRSLWLGVLVCAAMFVACGDDDSDFATRPSDGSSSLSSSSVKSNSSTKSSSSSTKSSSSVTLATPCKTDTEDNCEYGELLDDRDGEIYKTVKIGDQVWMAENLNYETDSSSCYNYSIEYCVKYGRLYTWAAAMDSAGLWSANGNGCGYDVECAPAYPVRGVCPRGWHLPSYDEWNILFSAVGDWADVNRNLRSRLDWKMARANGTDAFGFSALPAGDRFYNGYSWHFSGGDTTCTFFWSSTEGGSDSAYSVYLYYSYKVQMNNYEKNRGFSVRCLKDESNSSSAKSSSSELSSSSKIGCKTKKEDNCEYGELVDNRDGQTYKTVKIGDQWWMAENLNYETDSSFCYNNADSNCTKYGRLYTWAAAMDSAGTWTTNGKGCGYDSLCSSTYPVRGVCPGGWHLPDTTEWKTLLNAAGGLSFAGKLLKSTTGWNDSGNGTDFLGFSAIPAGSRGFRREFYAEGASTAFWSSTERHRDAAYNLYFRYSDGKVFLTGDDKSDARSVRCLKD